MRRRFFAIFATSLMGVLASGCITQNMWDHATANDLQFQHAVGFSRPKGQAVESPPRIVIGYGVSGHGIDRYFAVPSALLRDDLPTVESDWMKMRRDVTGPDLFQVRQFYFAPSDERRKSEIAPFYSVVHSKQMTGASYGLPPGVVAIALTAEGAPTQLRSPSQEVSAPVKFAVVPAHQPRSSGGRAGNIALATLATPFTIVADVVVDPIGIVMSFFWE